MDIIFEANSDVCSVDSNGNVLGVKQGNGIVLIKSSDGKHAVKCHIFVRE